MRKILLLTLLIILLPVLIYGQEVYISTSPDREYGRKESSGEEILTDLLLVRPLLLGFTIIGTCGYLVSLPFTLMGSNAKHAGMKLVVTPAYCTFTYPLGSYFNKKEWHTYEEYLRNQEGEL